MTDCTWRNGMWGISSTVGSVYPALLWLEVQWLLWGGAKEIRIMWNNQGKNSPKYNWKKFYLGLKKKGGSWKARLFITEFITALTWTRAPLWLKVIQFWHKASLLFVTEVLTHTHDAWKIFKLYFYMLPLIQTKHSVVSNRHTQEK